MSRLHSIIKYSTLIILLLLVSCSSNDNYIELSSMDGGQHISLKARKALILQNTIIDTALLNDMMTKRDYSDNKFQSIIDSSDDSSNFVFKIDKYYQEKEDESFITIIGQLHEHKLVSLYYFGAGQRFDYFQLNNDYIEIKNQKGQLYLYIYASLKSVGFSLSSYIQFPYNDAGGYSNVVRYLNIKTKMDVSDTGVPKYFVQEK